ncbi:MAG: FAD-dependent oxidoreductase [Paracoccaceae bacterium]|jgi:glycine/D-amino acid oxidase-like deaminating enzyme
MTTGFDIDVVVIGAGIFGLSVAWSCLKRGMSVTIVEKATIGAGASGGVMGALSPNVPENWSPKKQFQLDALLTAEAHWAGIDAISGLPSGYGRLGRIIPITNARGLEHAEIRTEDAKSLWDGEAFWHVEEATKFNGWIAPDAAPFGVIHENLSARINPRLACLSLAKALQFKGCEILEGWEMATIDHNEISGPSGTIRTKAIVMAAGVACFPYLEALWGRNAGMGVKGQSAVLGGVDAANVPMIFGDHTYIIPHENGDIAVGSTSENTYGDPYSVDEHLDQVIERAATICPALHASKVKHTWANVRPRARKPDPMLGPIDGPAGLYMATGGFKIGFGIAHKCGETIAAMIAGETVFLPKQFHASFAEANK